MEAAIPPHDWPLFARIVSKKTYQYSQVLIIQKQLSSRELAPESPNLGAHGRQPSAWSLLSLRLQASDESGFDGSLPTMHQILKDDERKC